MKRNEFVVYDRNVEKYALGIAKGRPALAITADEEHKTLESVAEICRWLLGQGADRSALVIAVGGGVTTDLVGFAASIYKRGVRYGNYPTTLLAMVDAGIGGKTGANLDSYKNMLGVIAQPEFTRSDVDVLKTLPEREFRSGAAEMLKTFIIGSEAYYEKAVRILSAPERDYRTLAKMIEAAAKIKRRIVRRDPYEKGLRRVLNLGHTYGHAIEWYQHTHEVEDPLTHGEAVAVGIIEAARMSEELKLAEPGLFARLAKDFEACGLPTEFPCPKEELSQAVILDKKADRGKVNFVLIKKIGKVVIKKI